MPERRKFHQGQKLHFPRTAGLLSQIAVFVIHRPQHIDQPPPLLLSLHPEMPDPVVLITGHFPGKAGKPQCKGIAPLLHNQSVIGFPPHQLSCRLTSGVCFLPLVFSVLPRNLAVPKHKPGLQRVVHHIGNTENLPAFRSALPGQLKGIVQKYLRQPEKFPRHVAGQTRQGLLKPAQTIIHSLSKPPEILPRIFPALPLPPRTPSTFPGAWTGEGYTSAPASCR